jgi:hypothetical protein
MMANYRASLRKLQATTEAGFAERDWDVGISLAIVASLCVLTLLLLSDLFLISQD